MKPLTLTAGIVLLAGAAIAAAHTHLLKSVPADGQEVSTTPATVVLTFSEAARLTAAWIQKDEGERAKLGPLPESATTQVTLALPALTPGTYVVSWRAASADGHVMPGRIRFTVSPRAPSQRAREVAPDDHGEVSEQRGAAGGDIKDDGLHRSPFLGSAL
jgi:copper transport protein